MKNFILLLTLIFLSGTLFAQQSKPDVDVLRVGINGAFFTSGDIYMPAISIDYAHPLNNFMAISPRIIGAYHNKVRYGVNRFSSSLAAALSLRIKPLPGIFDPLKFDIGALYHHYKTSELFILDPATSTSANYSYLLEDLFGLIGSISIDFPSKRQLFWGGRFDVLTSFHSDYFNIDSWQLGIYGGLKF